MLGTKSHADNVVDILAMTIFADKQVLSEEISSFVATILWLQNENIIDSNFSEARLILWYEINKNEFIAALQNHSFEKWLEPRLKELSDFPHKAHVFEAMLSIARADNEEHISEQALAVLIARSWGMEEWALEQLNKMGLRLIA